MTAVRRWVSVLLEWTLLGIGLGCLGVYAYETVEARRFQTARAAEFARAAQENAPVTVRAGGLVGMLDVPRLKLMTPVIEGDDDRTLKRAVGHLPDTPLPWEGGNSAIAGHRFQHQRIADPFGDLENLRVSCAFAQRLFGARHDGNPGFDGRLSRCRLAAHQRDGFWRRPDKNHTGIAARRREIFVFGEEAVAWMNRIGARSLSDLDDFVDAQVTVTRRARANRPRLVRQTHVQRCAIAFGVNRYGGDAHVATGTNDPNRNLAAVGHQNLVHQPEPLPILTLRLGYWPENGPIPSLRAGSYNLSAWMMNRLGAFPT